MYYLICCYKDSNILSFLQAFKKKILSDLQFFPCGTDIKKPSSVCHERGYDSKWKWSTTKPFRSVFGEHPISKDCH